MTRIKNLRSNLNRVQRAKPTSWKKRIFHVNVLPDEHAADITAEDFFDAEENCHVRQLKLQLGGVSGQLRETEGALTEARMQSKTQVFN